MSVSFCQTLFKLFFETFYFVSLYRSFLTTLLSYHDCRILSNTFLFFLSSLFHILTRDKKSTLRVRLFELERVKRIELSQSAWKAEVLPLNYTRRKVWPSDVLLSHLGTTLGAKELNFCVRYGNRCALLAIITRPLKDVVNLPKLDIFFSFFG